MVFIQEIANLTLGKTREAASEALAITDGYASLAFLLAANRGNGEDKGMVVANVQIAVLCAKGVRRQKAKDGRHNSPGRCISFLK